MKNLEVNFVAYNKVEGYILDKFTMNSQELVKSLVDAYEANLLEEGTQVFPFANTNFIIDVRKDINEIQVIDIA